MSLQLLHPWCPAFGIKLSHNQLYVTFRDPQPPARLRSSIKLDIMTRRARPHFDFCQKMVSARSDDNGTNEDEWFQQAADLLQRDSPHSVRTLFHDGAAYDLRMQRAVSVLVTGCYH